MCSAALNVVGELRHIALPRPLQSKDILIKSLSS